MRSNKIAIMLAGLLCLDSISAAEPVREISVGSDATDSTAITVYNDNLALVKERRKVNLPSGLVRLSLREVSAQLRPETALLRAVSGSPFELLEQNFDFDLLTPAKLLEKYVGHEVTVIHENPTTGAEHSEKATVLAANNGVVLRFADRIETGVPGRLAFGAVPANLRDKPTLSLLMKAAGGHQTAELSYLTGGLAWHADYVANLSHDGKTVDLSGWVTLTNSSGAAYREATLQLVAGNVNRVQAQPMPARMHALAAAAPQMDRAAVQQEALLDYHLYTFDRPTTIEDNQTKQLALLSAAAIPVRHQYLLTGADYYYQGRYGQIGQKLKPAIFIEFDNKGDELGKPLPAGVMRVYARDSKGAAQFVGEDRIDHTAKNEKVRLRLGEAFDITADRVQTNYRKIADNAAETTYKIEIRNAKDETVTVHVQEPMPGDWEITNESLPHLTESSRIVSWDVPVAPGAATTLQYTARTHW